MHDPGTDNEPAAKLVGTDRGNIDINNISGKKKLELITEGDLTPDDFIAPPNMPGAKLAKLRESHRTSVEASIKEITNNSENTLKIGDLVEYRGYSSDVIDIDPNKGVLITKKEGKKTWVHHTRVKLVKEPEE